MEKKKVIVIGGDAAGMSAASQIKRLQPDWNVIVFEKSNFVSYAACGMPYYIEGLISKFESLIEITPEKFINDRKIDLRMNNEVVKVFPQDKYVLTKKGDKEDFDYLVIATGAIPITEGINTDSFDKLFTLNNLTDAKLLFEYIFQEKPKSCAVLGGGFIAIEMVEALKERGIETHLIHRRDSLSKAFEIEISDMIINKMKENEIILHLNTQIQEIKHNSSKIRIFTDNNEIDVDFVVVCFGVKPNTAVFKEAGIKTGIKDGIIINEKCQTNFPYIYSAGDCALAKNLVNDKLVFSPLALKANREGYVAGRNIAGKEEKLKGITQTAITKIFNLGIARTGITLEEAKKSGFNAIKFDLISRTKARYYPDSQKIKTVVIADKDTGKLLGAQMAGPIDSVKRIDVFATALFNKMTMKDIFQLDLAYSPPFSPVWDPVLLSARISEKYLK